MPTNAPPARGVRVARRTRWLTAGLLIAGAAVTITGSLGATDDGPPAPELGAPVPVETVDPQGLDLNAGGFGDDGHVWQPPAVAWPRAGVVHAAVDGTARMIAGTPVSLASTEPLSDVEVETYGRDTARSIGVDGVVVRLDSADAGPVRLGVDYRAFAEAYGGGWASRLALVQLTDCDGGTVSACRTRTPLESMNDNSGAVSATVAANGFYALTAEAGSDAGDYKATDLTAAGSWTAGSGSGGFSYNYPLRTPPSNGPMPSIGLSYSSQSHDGRTSGSNNQASWVGDGWTYEPGYVERSYKSCASDQDGGNNTDKTNDQCWDGDSNAITVSLNGLNTSLVKDDKSGVWRAADDKDWKVEKLGAPATSSNPTSEYWRVTTTDGTQYTFGSSVNSRWTVPVFGNNSGEACHASAFADSRCDQAYRWQVEKVVDVHGSQVGYTYGTETGYYGAGGDKDKRVSYVRGGWLSRIDYGLRSGDTSVTPTARVVFDTADRCLSDCGTADDPKTENWPDTPWDLRCKVAPCTDQMSPAFFSSKRLTTITTQVASGTGFRNVDRWMLTHEFKDYGDKSQVVMWLKSVQHTGLAGGAPIDLPPTSFEGQAMPNRVETGSGIPAVWRSRITAISTETGGVIGVKYSNPDCAAGDLPSADESNTRLCYPVWWTPEEYWKAKKDWFRKYVVTAITEHDPIANTPSKLTSYDYSTAGGGTDVLWAWDDGEFTEKDHRTYGQWRGYAQVTTKVGDPAQGQTLNTRTSYYRGLDGQRLPSGTRSVQLTDSEGNTVTDHEALAGSVFETVKLNGTTIDSATVSRYWTRNTANRDHDGGTLKAWMTGESEKTTRRLLTGTTWQRTRTATGYDDHGRAVKVDDQGDITKSTDDLCTRTEYGTSTSTWLMASVVREEKVSAACDAATSRPGDVVSDTRTFFDGSNTFGFVGTRGLPTKVQAIDHWSGGPVYQTTNASTYDALGRELTKTDADGRITTTAYTPSGAGATTSNRVTNALGHAVVNYLDPAWGMTTATVDANARRTDIAYDALGRTTAVWLPGQSMAAKKPANQLFGYLVSNTAPSTVTTQRLTPRLTYVRSVDLYDSQLHRIETQSDTPIGGRLVTETGYNSRGEKSYSSGPNYDNTATPNGTLVHVDPGADHARTVYTYDDLSRVTNEAFWSKNVHRWDTATVYGGSADGLLSTVTPPAGGIKTATLLDARDRAVEKRQYRSDGTYAPVAYTFTPSGKLATVADAAGNTWSYQYDLRGNRSRATDPDTGLTVYGYDAVGRETSRTDARGVTVSTVYDELGRTTSTWSGAPDTGTKLSDHTYDTVAGGLGLLTASRSYVDGIPAVTSRIGKYDEAGRATQHYTDIAPIPGLEHLAGSYLYTTVFAPDGQLAGMGLSGYAGMDPENIAYGYNTTGQPTRMVGTNATNGATEVYVDAASYTAFGEAAQRTLGNISGRRVYQTGVYEDGTRRRRTLTLSKDGAPAVNFANLVYGYDDIGNVTSIADQSPSGGERQCFAYDDLRRMSEAWAQGGAGDCANRPSVSVLGGPGAYWSSYTHDVTGNRTSETRHTMTGETTDTYTYPAAGTPGAHLVSAVESGSGTDTYTTDPGGNLTGRTVDGEEETLSWNASGKLASIEDADGTTRMVYDADGNRVARMDANGDATLFAAQYELSYHAATGTTTGLRSYTHNGETIATRSNADGLVWVCGDHHGTATWTVASASMAVTIRRQDPYGNARGAAVAWNAGQRGFVGGVDDPSGLVSIGARFYDPRLGRFVSADPIADFTDPQQINGYTYSNANPVTFSDPTGKLMKDDSGGGPAYAEGSDDTSYEKVKGQLGCDARYLKPGSQCMTFNTDYKVDGDQGIIVANLFIATDLSGPVGLELHGDGRGFSADPLAGSRAKVIWDTKTGQVTVIVSPSCDDDGCTPALPLCNDCGDANNVDVHKWTYASAFPDDKSSSQFPYADREGWTGMRIGYDMQQSRITDLPSPQTNGSIYLGMNGSTPAIGISGDDYPSFESYQYKSYGSWSLGSDAQSSLGFGAMVNDVDSRNHLWHDGTQIR